MPAEWVERSGVFKIGTLLFKVDLRQVLDPIIDSVMSRHPVVNRRTLELIADNCNGALLSYLALNGVVDVGWRITASVTSKDLQRVRLGARTAHGRRTTVEELEQHVAAEFSARASRA
jgi:hypothetical protein